MKTHHRLLALVTGCALALGASETLAQDWPQWRGPNRDASITGFTPPDSWPETLTESWKLIVGEGVATPALVGGRLYVFSRQNGREITRCLDAATGRELWKDEYDALGAEGPASRFSGPRSSPAVAGGKVVTMGVRGVVSCLNADTGAVLWRKDDFKGEWPRFFTSSSPVIAGNQAIAQVGGDDRGGIIAYNLETGGEAWRWTGDAPAYASPVLMTVGGENYVIAQTSSKMVALNLTDGKLAWEAPFPVQGRGYNTATPIVDGQTLIYCGSGRGAIAVKLEKADTGLTATELWKNPDASVQFNTPVLKDGFLYGLSAGNEFFCLNAGNGQMAWTAPVAAQQGDADGQQGGGRRGRGGRGGGYGSIVDAGSVLLALTPGSELIVFKPATDAYTEVARVKVADSSTHAYPVVSGSRLFVKDEESIASLAVR